MGVLKDIQKSKLNILRHKKHFFHGTWCCDDDAFYIKQRYFYYKMGQKSGNPVPDLFHFGGDGMRLFLGFQVMEFRPQCRTKFSDYAGKPYNISILANVEIQLLQRTDVSINTESPYKCWI